MKIWHFSDTHERHEQLTVPEFDLAIFSGDAENSRDLGENYKEFISFVEWFSKIPGIKLATPGNHSLWTEANEKKARQIYADNGIKLLINESVDVFGLKIYGSPLTPEFHSWAYNRKRENIGRKAWSRIPDDTDIVVTHGPVKGVLDLTINHNHKLEQGGDSALGKRIEQIRPKLVCQGHFHTEGTCLNTGVLIRNGIIYSNASCLSNDQKIVSSGHLFNFEGGKITPIIG